MRDAGTEFAGGGGMGGDYREVAPPTRLVSLFRWQVTGSRDQFLVRRGWMLKKIEDA